MAHILKFCVAGLFFTTMLFAQSNPVKLTDTPQHFELNPSFAEQGRSVLFMVFTGDVDHPKPWDYALCKSDILASATTEIAAPGVIDYSVQNNGFDVLILRTNPTTRFDGSGHEFYTFACDWEIRRLNLKTGAEERVASAKGRPLAHGYAHLGVDGFPDSETGRYVTKTPDGMREILVQREKEQRKYHFKFYRVSGQEHREIFTTEAWQSYRDVEWFPPVVWLDNSSFLTLGFHSDSGQKFPQSEGLFSIVKFNLNKNEATVIYKNSSLDPFSKLAYNSQTGEIFFQKFNANTQKTELCRLNPDARDVEIVYESKTDLGEVRFDPSGTEAVFTQFHYNTTDIMRIMLDRNRIERLARN